MRVLFLHSDKPRERVLAEAFLDGVKAGGDYGEKRELAAGPTPADTSFDVACMVGVKSRELFRRCADAGMRVIYLDKGYSRHKSKAMTRSWEYWRVSVGSHHPTRYLMNTKRPGDRWEQLGFQISPWRKNGEHIVFAGSSQKYHEFYGLSAPTKFATKTFGRLRSYSDREIIYRPKPSWREAVPIEGTVYSQNPQTIYDVLAGAHALLTHGSNACFEAALCGIPSVIIGDAVAKPISSTSMADIEKPMVVSDRERRQWFYNLAWQQWTMPEMSSGIAWQNVRPLVYE